MDASQGTATAIVLLWREEDCLQTKPIHIREERRRKCREMEPESDDVVSCWSKPCLNLNSRPFSYMGQ